MSSKTAGLAIREGEALGLEEEFVVIDEPIHCTYCTRISDPAGSVPGSWIPKKVPGSRIPGGIRAKFRSFALSPQRLIESNQDVNLFLSA
jgi:hypothetical protein